MIRLGVIWVVVLLVAALFLSSCSLGSRRPGRARRDPGLGDLAPDLGLDADVVGRVVAGRVSKLISTAAVAIAATLAVFALAGCGSEGGAEAEAPAVKRPSADPPDFHQTEYDVNTTWEQEVSDKRVGYYLESIWHDPAVPQYKLLIDSRASEGTPPPLASAELARLQVSWLPDYRELGFEKSTGHPAIRWTYYLGGAHRFEYFFAECGISIALRGSGPVGARAFGGFYGIVASRVKPVCVE
jgi:hypothetical protein